MSTLKVNTIQDTTGNDALTIDSSGNVTASQGFVPSTQLSHRNLIINGAMQVAQRGTSFTGNNEYTADRWTKQISGSGGASTVTANSSGGPSAFPTYIRNEVTTADASVDANNLIVIKQLMEGYTFLPVASGTSDAKPLSLSFWVRSSITGTFSVALDISGASVRYGQAVDYTIDSANTWEYKTLTFTAQDNAQGLANITNEETAQLRFCLMCGSSYAGTSGQWEAGSNIFGSTNQTNLFATNGATWDLTGVQLEVGSVATPFEHRSYGEELARCQRYYYQMVSPTASQKYFASGHYYSTGLFAATYSFPVTMRASPTLNYVTGTSYYVIYTAGSPDLIDAFASVRTHPNGGGLDTSTGTSGTVGNGGALSTNNANSAVGFDAEL